MDPAGVRTRRALTHPATVARMAWLERFYDLVFAAAVGRFADELEVTSGLAHMTSILGWLAWLWVAWFLVSLRLNRFPDEGWLIRGIVVAQPPLVVQRPTWLGQPAPRHLTVGPLVPGDDLRPHHGGREERREHHARQVRRPRP